jgi:hypothetical protein
MIIGALRLAFIAFVAMTVAYLLIWIYSRSVRREELEKEWDAGGIDTDRETYIADGMTAYEHTLRRRLIGLVYIVPTVIVLVIIYIRNFQ